MTGEKSSPVLTALSFSIFRFPHGNVYQGTSKATTQAWVKGSGCREMCQQHKYGTVDPGSLGEHGDGGGVRKGPLAIAEGRLRCGCREQDSDAQAKGMLYKWGGSSLMSSCHSYTGLLVSFQAAGHAEFCVLDTTEGSSSCSDFTWHPCTYSLGSAETSAWPQGP